MKRKTLFLSRATLVISTFFVCTTCMFAQSQLGANSSSNSIDSTGNVGIGTSSPTHQLEVVGDSKFTGTIEVDSASVFNDSIIMMSSRVEEDLIVEGDLIMRKYVNDTMMAPRSVYFTTDGTILPAEEVHCAKAPGGPFYPIWESGLSKLFTYCHESDAKVGINTNNPLQALDVRGSQYVSGNLGLGVSQPTQKLEVQGNQYLSGKLGIGTVANTDKLEVAGTIRTASTDGKMLRMFAHPTSGYNGIRSTNTSNGHVELRFQTGNTGGTVRDAMVINTDGNIGIGTTTPVSTLDVNGDQHISGLLNIETSGNYNQKHLTLTHKNASSPHRSMFFVSKSDGWPTAIVENGDFGIFWNDNEGGGDNQAAGFAIAPSGYLGNVETGLRITSQGWVGIGQANPQSMLAVNGKITAKEVEVTLTGFSDFVFHDDYKLRTLTEVEQFINTHKHLPDVPSEQEVLENGLNLGEMDALLLQKVEELTLYVIELSKKVEEQEKDIEDLKQNKD